MGKGSTHRIPSCSLACICIVSLALSSCFLLDADGHKRIAELRKRTADLITKINAEPDLEKQERLENDVQLLQKTIGEILKKLSEERKKIDFTGLFSNLQKNVERALNPPKKP